MIKILTRTGNGTAQIRFHDNDLMNAKSIENGTNVTHSITTFQTVTSLVLVTCPTSGPDEITKEIKRLSVARGRVGGQARQPPFYVHACVCPHIFPFLNSVAKRENSLQLILLTLTCFQQVRPRMNKKLKTKESSGNRQLPLITGTLFIKMRKP